MTNLHGCPPSILVHPDLNSLSRNPLKQLKKFGFGNQELRANPSSAVLVTFLQTFPHLCMGEVYLVWGCWKNEVKQLTRKKACSTHTVDSKTPASMRSHFSLLLLPQGFFGGSLPKWQGIHKWSFGFHGFQRTIRCNGWVLSEKCFKDFFEMKLSVVYFAIESRWDLPTCFLQFVYAVINCLLKRRS